MTKLIIDNYGGVLNLNTKKELRQKRWVKKEEVK